MTRSALLPLFLRQFALSLAALCLLFQALVPPGYMLAAGEGGFPLSVVICGQTAPVSAAELGLTHADEAPENERVHAPCLMAGFGAALAEPDFALSAAPVAYARAALPPARDRAALSIGANAPPPSRAPPSIV